MEGADWLGRWKNLKQRLRFKVIGCCGSSWSYSASSMSVLEESHQEEEELIIGVRPFPANNRRSSAYGNQIPAASGMNLAAALAAERNSRAVGPPTVAATAVPLKTLMRLIEETDGLDLIKNGDKEGGGGDGVCCVCMERNKGAAFIPCGHTFCRVCSRELWLNRGCCPICNRSILEILDIF